MCNKTKSPFEFNNQIDLITYFKDEKTCLKYIEEWLWEGNIRCLYCGHYTVYRYSNGVRFKCKNCKEYFSAKVGTIFESSKLPLVKWFLAMYLIGSYKKGISSCQLARELGVTQKTAWIMAHKIRNAMRKVDAEKLEGVIEVDETFVGGKNKNRHKDKKVKYTEGRTFQDKTPVVGMMQRGGELRCTVTSDTKIVSIRPVILDNIKEGSTLYTDEWAAYKTLPLSYKQAAVDHSKGMYRNGDVCTNAIESFWSHLKRMIIGVYHKVSRKHLQRYVDEITFRFNSRHMKQGERLRLMFTQIRCPLNYKKLISNYG